MTKLVLCFVNSDDNGTCFVHFVSDVVDLSAEVVVRDNGKSTCCDT